MRIELALHKRDRALTALRDVYSAGRISGSTSADLERRRHETLRTHAIDKCPAWVRAYLDGAWRQMIDTAYRQDLVYGGFVGERFYSTHRNRPDYYEINGIEPSAYADDGLVTQRGHYWIASVDAGKPKPFFVSTP